MLVVEGLTAGYGPLVILRDISLKMLKGEAVAIVGANGAGKTTLVRALCGLNRAHGGRIVKNGIDITGFPAHARPRHGMAALLENRRLFGEFTVRDNLRLAEEAGRKHRGRDLRFTWDDICDLFPMIGERERTRVELLSGGQQQMVAIARGLLLQPDLLVLDEPSTGLAPKVVKEILQVLHNLRARGMGILLIEQNVGIAIEITDRAYVMSLGRIIHAVDGNEWRGFMSDERLAKAFLG
ncbi:ABC transporter ATP-binding protein [Bradyrhizobium sp. Ash2021]|uniref:ABC transporter ATP-binding protein n=1 Tax=Bradyrhizobium sp. Ash2021 TaxID=2954771 RepID=UPI002815947C|nr:ABC transporter ATP-binding protein [Bradyrhizobium sp. Ash2021]WMT76424.1 ABC transporter ATP-binding protein [Bradyrhizobium sp. Ash2021]WMT76438.1 ABC transporter ATP-binding protein [Bradyrhizobium sp. Ash2021]